MTNPSFFLPATLPVLAVKVLCSENPLRLRQAERVRLPSRSDDQSASMIFKIINS